MWKVYLLMFCVTAVISYLWVRAIDNMKKSNPDYKGEDFLNWDGKNPDWDNVNQKRKEWDDNHVHTEGDF